MATKTQTEAVLKHHVQAILAGNLEDIMKDYSDESVLFTPQGAYKGRENIRAAFKGLLGVFTPELAAKMKLIKQDIDGEYACALWSAAPTIPFGGDTFCVRNGKIIMQSFVGQMGK
jgi:ketosteroid isomerase-like protein